MTDKMKQTLNDCFDARIRELKQTLALFTDDKIAKPIADELKSIEAVKECHNIHKIFEK